MADRCVLVLFLVLSFCCIVKDFCCYGHQFVVGGKDGWVLNPSENYNHWAERNRFQVNDTLRQWIHHSKIIGATMNHQKNNGRTFFFLIFDLRQNDVVLTKMASTRRRFDTFFVPELFGGARALSCLMFKYKKGSDSVVVVNKNDYYNCNNTGNSILKFKNGNSVFKFEHSGPFYFISGIKANCDRGQKLVVVVLAVRNRHPTAHSPIAPPPKGSSPSPSPATGSPAPGISTPSRSPSDGAHSPSRSPSSWSPSPATGAHAPSGSAWSPSPSNGAPSPAVSPSSPSPQAEAPEISTSYPSPEAGAPGPLVPSSGLSPASGAPGPAISSSGPSPSNASPTAPVSPNSSTPGTGTPADGNSPGGSPRRSFASPTCRPSVIFASLVLSMGLGGFAVSN
ncbi:hypothetical protein OROGR_007302 [Orobanche gracilis]